MKKNLPILAIFIAIMLCGCTNKKNQYPISDLNADFTVTENLEFKHFNHYDITTNVMCLISDSVLWCFGGDRSVVGYCHNINSGKKISTIAMLGKASCEFTELPALKFMGDSIQFSQNRNTIKTFAIKDIVENKSMSERVFSMTTVPDSILVSGMVKLPNGSVVATIMPVAYSDYPNNKHNINNNSIAIFNSSEANSYATIDFEKYNVKDAEKEISDKIKLAYAQGQIATKGNDFAVFSVHEQFILYTFDLNNKNVVKEKRYTQFQNDSSKTSFVESNDKRISIYFLNANDNYIFCHVRGYFTDPKELEQAIFVFNWDLNPIKRFNLPKDNTGYYLLSGDCKSVHFYKDTDNGIEVSKVDLNLE